MRDPELLLSYLNPQQKEAVLAPERALLVFAGAGSGKTRVLTYRIAYLIGTKKAKPHEIMALTFTNKAANEMKERLQGLLGELLEGLWVGTFHGIAARILRVFGSHLNLRSDFVIYDEDDQLKLLEKILKSMDIDPKVFPPSKILKEIERAKNRGIGPEAYEPNPFDLFQKRTAQVYMAYQEALREANALDYGDLLLGWYKLLQIPEIKTHFHHRFKHILVDEYQDTNYIQYFILKELYGPQTSIMVVGDDDQSIYAWRGAEPGNIFQFQRDFPGVRVIKLEQNYRSTKTILEGANAVISRNQIRTPKRLWTQNPEGKPIVLYGAQDEREEAFWVAQKIVESKRPFSHFAVFYRITAQSRVLEEAMIKLGIPYVIIGGLRFYERREIKDLLAYLRLVVNPQDEISLRRIINVPPRGIGPKTLEKLELIAKKEGLPLWNALKKAISEKGELKGHQALKGFVSLIEDLRSKKDDLSPEGLLQELINRIRYFEYLQSLEGSVQRIENVQEFLEALSEQEGSLEEIVQHMSLLSDVDQLKDRSSVVLMTLHSAKGLEFPVVFIVGLEEGLLPYYLRIQNPMELEEERRLFYVGMTRAQEELYLSYAVRRGLFGKNLERVPSRFLEELPSEILKREGRYHFYRPKEWAWQERDWYV